ncbi:MAG: bifunctional glutamate N-acetyltransferase/amino-acid acetyltransferase ArgJ [bacterium]|nr:MAG: bifunctional glutamate N-acetyltransferase/amino-acid acetyltransferase ArgJ [bacterium]
MGRGNLRVPGFLVSTASADVRGKGDGRLDMGLIFCEKVASAAGTFTRNRMAAAPVVLTSERVGSGTARAVLVNSGNANCMTGRQGMADAVALCRALADHLGVADEMVLNCSTGVVGERLPADRMTAALRTLSDDLSPDGLEEFARAIMTTDTYPKSTSVEVALSTGSIRLAGVAKGAGMIAPDMATMLAFILTDADIPAPLMTEMLSEAVDVTFNAVTVDGDTSTNDTVLFLASGVGPGPENDTDGEAIRDGLREVCRALAEMIVSDGEGTKKVVEIRVTGAADHGEARRTAKSIGQSLLVKTALAAADPNWGRIAVAVGYAGARTSPEEFSLRIGDVTVIENGNPAENYREELAAGVMAGDRYTITVAIGKGPGEACVLTTDLTEEYVRINSEYRS